MNQWLEALRRIIENPSQNAPAIATGVAIIVLFVVVIALALIAFALPGKEEDTLAGLVAEPKPGPPRWVGWVVGAIVTVAGILGATSLWYVATGDNDYCTRSCHAMAEATETWSVSAHTAVSCVRCHEGQKWNSLPLGLANRTKCLYYQITRRPAHNMKVSSDNCMSCHSVVIGKPVIARNGETFLHGEALTKDPDCARCHGAQGHELGNP